MLSNTSHIRERSADVGVDAWGGYPVSFETVAEMFASGEECGGVAVGEISRAKDHVYDCLPDTVIRTDQLEDALSALYALGSRHGEAEAECEWEQRTDALRRLARAATEFVSEGADPDTTYPRFKEALEAWWEHAGVWG